MPKKPSNAPSYRLAQENPMFTHEQTALVRMVKFKEPVACGLCGSKRKNHWTTLVPFHAFDINDPSNRFALNKAGPPLPPLTPVCNDHILAEDTEVMNQMSVAFRYFFDLTVKRLREQKAKK